MKQDEDIKSLETKDCLLKICWKGICSSLGLWLGLQDVELTSNPE